LTTDACMWYGPDITFFLFSQDNINLKSYNLRRFERVVAEITCKRFACHRKYADLRLQTEIEDSSVKDKR
jgi:hypothetical protein